MPRIIHGLTKTSIHDIWRSMRQRCLNKKNKAYKNYGGRGIKVCKEWESFEIFYKDMGERPEGMTLDRINNDGNYEKSNCRWATDAEQTNNTRANILLTFEGMTKNVAQWARFKGFNIQQN